MKKPFDKKSTSGLAKKPEKPQVQAPATGSAPDARQDRAPQHKPKGKKAEASNMPMILVRPPHSVCGEGPVHLGAFGPDSSFAQEHN